MVFSNTAPNLDSVETAKLFDRFYTVRTAGNSTGLGLSIAKALCEDMNGKIYARYDDGRIYVTVELWFDISCVLNKVQNYLWFILKLKNITTCNFFCWLCNLCTRCTIKRCTRFAPEKFKSFNFILFSSGVDITEQKRIQCKIRTSQNSITHIRSVNMVQRYKNDTILYYTQNIKTKMPCSMIKNWHRAFFYWIKKNGFKFDNFTLFWF